jgi:hypothetical protein
MEEDVQVQVEKLKQSLEVADLIESERGGKPRRKRKNRLPRPDYSKLHQMQDRLDELNRPRFQAEQVSLPAIRKRQELSLPNITPGAPEMQARMGLVNNGLKKTEHLLRVSLDEQHARAPFLPAPGVQVKATKSMGALHSTVFTSDYRANFREAPGFTQTKSLPKIENRRAPYF